MSGLYPIIRRVRRPLLPVEDGGRPKVVPVVEPEPIVPSTKASTVLTANAPVSQVPHEKDAEAS